MSEHLDSESDNYSISLDKLAINSNEIDKNTGRIILPSSGMLNSMQQGGPNVTSQPSNEQGADSRVSDKETATQAVRKPLEPAPAPAAVSNREVLTLDQGSESGKKALITSSSTVLALVGCFLLVALIWLGIEIRLTRAVVERQNEIPVVIEYSPPAPRASEDSRPTVVSWEDSIELRQLLITTEIAAEDLSETLKEVERNVAGLHREVKNMEFEIIDSSVEDSNTELVGSVR